MQVMYLVSEASHHWSRMPGHVYDLPDAEAYAAIAAGKAEPVTPEPDAAAPEAATRSAAERAVRATPKGR
jgi:hypothetical protein